MRAIDAINRLGSSRSEDCQFLQTVNGMVLFGKKPQKSYLDRFIQFFLGEPDNLSFRVQVAKVKELFKALSKEEMTAEVVALEAHIDSLGCEVYTKKHQRSLCWFMKPTLSDFQIRYNPLERLVEPTSINQGLDNPSLKICWLNSAIKFIAATVLYDTMLTKPQKDPELERLRCALFRLVNCLRKNYSQTVTRALHNELIEELKKSSFRELLDKEQDPNEFLNALSERCKFEHRELIQQIAIYQSFAEHEGIYKAGMQEETPSLILYPNGKSEIGIEEAVQQPSFIEQIKEYQTLEESQSTREPRDFSRTFYIHRYPEYLPITLSRGENSGRVGNSKIQLDPHMGTVELTEYDSVKEVINGKEQILDVKARKPKIFQVQAGIEHIGQRSETGHYKAHTRGPDGITTHNDRILTYNSPETVWGNCYFLILKELKTS